MKHRSSHYPIGRFLIAILQESGASILEFTWALGYRDSEKGIALIDECITKGTASISFLGRLRKLPSIDSSALDKAIAETLKVFEIEHERELEALEREERQSFLPYITWDVTGEHPTQRQLSELCNAPRQENKITLAPEIISLPDREKLKQIKAVIQEHYTRNSGPTYFGGRITSYRLFTKYDADPVFFDLQGNYLGDHDGMEETEEPSVLLPDCTSGKVSKKCKNQQRSHMGSSSEEKNKFSPEFIALLEHIGRCYVKAKLSPMNQQEPNSTRRKNEKFSL